MQIAAAALDHNVAPGDVAQLIQTLISPPDDASSSSSAVASTTVSPWSSRTLHRMRIELIIGDGGDPRHATCCAPSAGSTRRDSGMLSPTVSLSAKSILAWLAAERNGQAVRAFCIETLASLLHQMMHAFIPLIYSALLADLHELGPAQVSPLRFPFASVPTLRPRVPASNEEHVDLYNAVTASGLPHLHRVRESGSYFQQRLLGFAVTLRGEQEGGAVEPVPTIVEHFEVSNRPYEGATLAIAIAMPPQHTDLFRQCAQTEKYSVVAAAAVLAAGGSSSVSCGQGASAVSLSPAVVGRVTSSFRTQWRDRLISVMSCTDADRSARWLEFRIWLYAAKSSITQTKLAMYRTPQVQCRSK